jgi:hypothetical protein
MPAAAGDITYSGQTVDLSGTGYGNFPTILSVQAHGSDTSQWGAVSWNGTDDVLAGDAKPAGTATRLVSELLADGVTKDLFGIVLNTNEDVNRDITLQDFSMEVYSSAGGAPLFIAVLTGVPLTLSASDPGQGQAGQLFWVNLSDTEWNTYFSTAPGNRVGMSIVQTEPILDVSAGAESFAITPIPEPASLTMLALGAVMLAWRRHLRR